MDASTSFKNHFLIAMPALEDPSFFHTVTYLCEHGDEGAIGLVLTHPMDVSVSDLLQHMNIPQTNDSLHYQAVLSGGPVQPERGFVIHRPQGEWESSLKASEEIAITSSRDILVALANEQGPQDFLLALGYAGWGAGQLEAELTDNAWLTCEASPDILFDTPFADRWRASAALLGVDLNMLSGDIGHA